MTSYPQYIVTHLKYPTRYYDGYYLMNDPVEWNQKGRVIPIRRLPGPRRKNPRQVYKFHPWISEMYYPPAGGVRTSWPEWYE